MGRECCCPVHQFECPIHNDSIAEYSTNIAAAWEVVEKLRQQYPLTKLVAKPHGPAAWQCEFFYSSDGRLTLPACDIHLAEADTAPLAICLAALKAVGHE